MTLIDAKAFAQKLLAVASDFQGLGEVVNNEHWDDPRTTFKDVDKDVWLRTWMAKVDGWTPGAPYCAAFVGAVVAATLKGYGVPMERIESVWLKLWCAHCMTNVARLKAKGVLSQVPVPGALWLAQSGNSQRGHAGIVNATNGRQMSTIEGNTNDAGSNEGDGIFAKQLPISGRSSLKTRGFLHPASILDLFHA